MEVKVCLVVALCAVFCSQIDVSEAVECVVCDSMDGYASCPSGAPSPPPKAGDYPDCGAAVTTCIKTVLTYSSGSDYTTRRCGLSGKTCDTTLLETASSYAEYCCTGALCNSALHRLPPGGQLLVSLLVTLIISALLSA